MKDSIISARSPFEGVLLELHSWHKRYVEAWFAASPPTHPDRLAKQALLLHDLELGKAQGGTSARRDVLQATTQRIARGGIDEQVGRVDPSRFSE